MRDAPLRQRRLDADESFRSMTEDIVLAPVVIDRKWGYLCSKLD